MRLVAVVALLALAQPAQPPGRAIAITIDDLPYVAIGSTDYLRDAQRATTAILRTLRAHQAPAVAFVNENKLTTDERIAVLKQWVDAGVVLGNHTYSHPDFNALSVEQFEDEIVRGEPTTRRLMASREPYPRYFRHPQTHTGDTIEKKQAIETFLKSRGYIVAPHTIENEDFVFNVPYARAVRSGDQGLAARVMKAYLDFTVATTAFAEEVAPKIFDRDIPQTLLIHSNDITADALERLLAAYEARGYRFITLEEAMGDRAYQSPDTLVTRSGPTWLFRWSRSLGKAVSFSYDPDPPEWVMDLYSAR